MSVCIFGYGSNFRQVKFYLLSCIIHWKLMVKPSRPFEAAAMREAWRRQPVIEPIVSSRCRFDTDKYFQISPPPMSAIMPHEAFSKYFVKLIFIADDQWLIEIFPMWINSLKIQKSKGMKYSSSSSHYWPLRTGQHCLTLITYVAGENGTWHRHNGRWASRRLRQRWWWCQ